MDERKRSKFFKVLVLKGTRDILKFLDEHGTAQYKQLESFASTYTLSTRLRDLLSFELIEHHFIKDEVRREWYEPTEKGRRVLRILEELEKLWVEE